MRRLAAVLVTLLAGCALDVEPTGGLIGAAPADDPTVSFALDILPVLQQDCVVCHGGAGGLDLDSYDALLAGGVSGAVVIPGDPDASLLPARLDASVPPRMPLDAPPLTDPEIDRIRQWIREGALDN